ncbi:MAG: hypothetical protein QG592_226, partial [Pseudomonadota bacterium]|nr:hypothetical protein [Pseudomonadota bacterium]
LLLRPQLPISPAPGSKPGHHGNNAEEALIKSVTLAEAGVQFVEFSEFRLSPE